MTRTGVRWVVGGVIASLMLFAQVQWLSAQGWQGRGRQQNQGRQTRQQVSGPPVETAGTVEAVMPGYIKMTTPDNKTWIIQVEANAKVSVTGKAKPDFLQQGMVVALSGDVDKRRSLIEEKIAKLTIVTPTELRPMGAFPAQGGGGLQGGIPAAGAPAPGAGSGAATERFDIVGQFAGTNKKGKSSVMIPNNLHFRSNLTVELVEELEIDIELEGPKTYTIARKGDKVEIRGKQVAPTGAVANEVKIVLTEPLTMAQAEKEKKGSRRLARGKKGDDDEPAEAKTDEKDAKAEKDKDAPKEDADKDKDADTDKAEAKDGRKPRRTTRTAGKRGEAEEPAAEESSEEKPAKAAAGREKAGKRAKSADKEEKADEEK